MQQFLSYFISRDIAPDTLGLRIMVWSAVALIVIPFLAAIILGKNRKLVRPRVFFDRYKAQFRLLQWASIVALVLLFLRYEAIYPFEMRIWVVLVALITLFLEIYGIMKLRRRLALETYTMPTQREEFTRYLPKTKKAR